MAVPIYKGEIIFGRELCSQRLVEDRTENSLPRLLSEVRAGDAVASFNWDTLAEHILGAQLSDGGTHLCQVSYPATKKSVPGTKKSVQFMKPHGSLSWPRSLAGSVAEIDGRPRLKVAQADEVVDQSSQPLVLGAVPMKAELVREVQIDENRWVFETIMLQWRGLCEALMRAERLDVLGYSFPPEDTHGRFLFDEASRQRRGRWKEVNLFAPPGAEGKRIRCRMAKALGIGVSDITRRGVVAKPTCLTPC